MLFLSARYILEKESHNVFAVRLPRPLIAILEQIRSPKKVEVEELV